MATVKITNLHKSYGSVEVLKGINLFIEDGGFLVLEFTVGFLHMNINICFLNLSWIIFPFKFPYNKMTGCHILKMIHK